MVEIGKKYNLLTVISESPKRGSGGTKFWTCQCDCGTVKDIRGDKIQSGHTKSCGCLNSTKRIKDISGRKYGFLTVIKPSGEQSKSGDIIWICQCKCGNFTKATKSSLDNNRVKSCGCLKSWGETIIEEILSSNNILHQREYIFEDLKDNGYLRFDFAILNRDKSVKYLIEFDGEQHYSNKKDYWDGRVDVELLHKHDIMKNDYCLQNNIPLIRIPYYIKDNILLKDLVLETSSYKLSK